MKKLLIIAWNTMKFQNCPKLCKWIKKTNTQNTEMIVHMQIFWVFYNRLLSSLQWLACLLTFSSKRHLVAKFGINVWDLYWIGEDKKSLNLNRLEINIFCRYVKQNFLLNALLWWKLSLPVGLPIERELGEHKRFGSDLNCQQINIFYRHDIFLLTLLWWKLVLISGTVRTFSNQET